MDEVSLRDGWNPAKRGGTDATARGKGSFSQEIVQLFTGDVQGLGQSINMGVLKNHCLVVLYPGSRYAPGREERILHYGAS